MLASWRRYWDLLPLTWAGVWLTLGSAAGLVLWGIDRQDQVVSTAAVAALLAVGLGALGVVLTTVWLVRALAGRQERPAGLITGRRRPTDLTLHLPWWSWSAVQMVWTHPPADAQLDRGYEGWEEWVVARRRGRWEQIVRQWTVTGPLGLARLRWEQPVDLPLDIHPWHGALESVPVMAGLRSGADQPHPEGGPEGDLLDLRAYGPGDPIRLVVWKVYAKHRELLVRTPERALSVAQRTVAYLVVHPSDGAAAGALSAALQRGELGHDGSVGADGVDEIATDAASAQELVIESGELETGHGGVGLARFLATTMRGGGGHVLIFAPPVPGPWTERVVQAVASQPGVRADVLLCVDGVRHAPTVEVAPGQVVPTEPELSAAVAGLAGLPGRVLLVDRERGTIEPFVGSP